MGGLDLMLLRIQGIRVEFELVETFALIQLRGFRISICKALIGIFMKHRF